jgi:Zn-dependent protease
VSDPEPGALERLRRLEAADRAGTRPGAPAASPSPRRRGIVGGVVAGVLLALTKGKALLLLIASKGGLLLSALKLGKLATTLGTMAISFQLYARLYHWKFALGLLVLILVHELGHGFAARRLGLRVGAPIFIPGFGAVIALKDQPRSTFMSAVVGYGGPLAGALGGLAVLAFGRVAIGPAERGFWEALAHVTFVLNLFNLLPVAGLDGDRITEPLRVGHWVAGLSTVVVAALLVAGMLPGAGETTRPEMLFAIAIVALGVLKAALGARRRARAARGEGRLVDRITAPEARYVEETSVTPRQRRVAAWAYFALVAALLLVSAWTLPPRA